MRDNNKMGNDVICEPAGAPHEDVGGCDVVEQHRAVAGAGRGHCNVQNAPTCLKCFQKCNIAELSAKYGAELADVKQSPGGEKTSDLAPQRPLLVKCLRKSSVRECAIKERFHLLIVGARRDHSSHNRAGGRPGKDFRQQPSPVQCLHDAKMVKPERGAAGEKKRSFSMRVPSFKHPL